MKYRIEIIRDDGAAVRPIELPSYTRELASGFARLTSTMTPGIVELRKVGAHGETLLARAINGKLSRV